MLQDVDKYDIIYLDGSDCPYQMMEQIKLCNLNKNIVLCDDFHTKGSIVKEYYHNSTLYRFPNGHEMAVFGKNIAKKLINL